VHDLSPLTALGGATVRRDKIGDLTIAETAQIALASVAARAGQDDACAAVLADLVDNKTGIAPGRMIVGTPYSALWMTPGQWMLSAPFETHEDIAADLKTRFGAQASITEQTDAWVCFDITGPTITTLLERLCPLPANRLTAGDASRTTIEHIGCFVLCRKAGSDLRILGPRSSAESLHHALCAAARSIA
jgi:sarcosine oxidase subunit gamma